MTLTDLEVRDFLARDYPRLVNAMAFVCGSVPAAEDAVQEGLARAWERSERGQWIESLPAFVASVARNLLRDRFRRLRVERRARRALAETPRVGPTIDEIAERTDLARALAALPDRQREVAAYHYVLDLEIAEISGILDVAEGTVKSALFRARRSLAAALGIADDDEPKMEVRDAAR